MTRFLLPAWLLLAAACSSGGGFAPNPDDVTPAPPAPPQGVASDVIVMLEDPDDDDEVEDIRSDFAGLSLTRIGQSSFFRLVVPAGTDVNRLLDDLDNDARVVFSQLDYAAEAPEGGPTDIKVLGGDLFSAVAVQPAFAGLDLAAAHSIATGAGVLVAVVDTGVDFGHPGLAPFLAPGGFDFVDQDPDPREERNFLDDDGDGAVDEQYGHGTFVASLVLAVAPGARILPVRVLGDEGIGTSSTVAAGIVWAVDAGAHVINVSVDIPESPEVVKEAVAYAKERDVVVVAAAGNAGFSDIIFPARFGDVVAVTATDAAGVAAPFANTGSKVALVAPGVELIGAVPTDLDPLGTARWSGTSFAAPLVAGAAALVRQAFPGFDHDAVVDRLEDTARNVDGINPGLVDALGAGLVQPAAAVGP